MAESVKILNPSKKVLVPDLGAGCSLVDEAPYSDYLKWRFENPDGIAADPQGTTIPVLTPSIPVKNAPSKSYLVAS
jgi:hypothetical protein